MVEETKNRFESRWTGVFVVLVLAIVGILMWNLHERTLKDAIIVFGLSALLFLFALLSKTFTFIEICPSHTIKNRRDFRVKTFNASEAIYIGRILLSRAPAICVFFKDQNGHIDYTLIIEANYSDRTILSLLQELQHLNRNLEMNEIYATFLKNHYLERGGEGLETFSEIKEKLQTGGLVVSHLTIWRELL